jgi:hypothetical protein
MFICPKRYARYHSILAILAYLEERQKRLGSDFQENLNGLLTHAISTGILNTALSHFTVKPFSYLVQCFLRL